jgi:hypothetical protein
MMDNTACLLLQLSEKSKEGIKGSDHFILK